MTHLSPHGETLSKSPKAEVTQLIDIKLLIGNFRFILILLFKWFIHFIVYNFRYSCVIYCLVILVHALFFVYTYKHWYIPCTYIYIYFNMRHPIYTYHVTQMLRQSQSKYTLMKWVLKSIEYFLFINELENTIINLQNHWR